jgi:hypothetical protein
MADMNIFKRAKAKADKLPAIVSTPELRRAIMLAEVAQWVYGLDFLVKLDDGDRAIAILKDCNSIIDLINESEV